MLTISKIKMKFVVIKSKLFTLSTRKKESHYKTIEELAFNSVFEENIFIVLRNKWNEIYWLFVATGTILGIIYFLTKTLS